MQNPSKISLLERVKIQSEVLVPLLKGLREELGEEQANTIVYRSLREWSRNLYQEIGLGKSGSGKEKWHSISEDLDELIGDDVDLEYLRNDEEALDFNVTGCRYAQFFLELEEPELGSILTCEIDNHIVEVGQPEVELSRPQTIMKGANHCQFRYRFNKNNQSGV